MFHRHNRQASRTVDNRYNKISTISNLESLESGGEGSSFNDVTVSERSKWATLAAVLIVPLTTVYEPTMGNAKILDMHSNCR
jgi:hypothetical protein